MTGWEGKGKGAAWSGPRAGGESQPGPSRPPRARAREGGMRIMGESGDRPAGSEEEDRIDGERKLALLRPVDVGTGELRPVVSRLGPDPDVGLGLPDQAEVLLVEV